MSTKQEDVKLLTAEGAASNAYLLKAIGEWNTLAKLWAEWAAFINKDEKTYLEKCPADYWKKFQDEEKKLSVILTKEIKPAGYKSLLRIKETETPDEVRLKACQEAIKSQTEALESLKNLLREKHVKEHKALKAELDRHNAEIQLLSERFKKIIELKLGVQDDEVDAFAKSFATYQTKVLDALAALDSPKFFGEAKQSHVTTQNFQKDCLAALADTLAKLQENCIGLEPKPDAPKQRQAPPPVISAAAILDRTANLLKRDEKFSTCKAEYQDCQTKLTWCEGKQKKLKEFCRGQPASEAQRSAIEVLAEMEETTKKLKVSLKKLLNTEFNADEKNQFTKRVEGHVKRLNQFAQNECVFLAMWVLQQELEAEQSDLLKDVEKSDDICHWDSEEETCVFAEDFQDKRTKSREAYQRIQDLEAWKQKVEVCKPVYEACHAQWAKLAEVWATWGSLIPSAPQANLLGRLTSKSPTDLYKAFVDQDKVFQQSLAVYKRALESSEPQPLDDNFDTQFQKAKQTQEKGLQDFKQFFIDACKSQYETLTKDGKELLQLFEKFSADYNGSQCHEWHDEVQVLSDQLNRLQSPPQPFSIQTPDERDHASNVEKALADGREKLELLTECKKQLADYTARLKKFKENAREKRIEEAKELDAQFAFKLNMLKEFASKTEETQEYLKKFERPEPSASTKLANFVKTEDVTDADLTVRRERLEEIETLIQKQRQKIFESERQVQAAVEPLVLNVRKKKKKKSTKVKPPVEIASGSEKAVAQDTQPPESKTEDEFVVRVEEPIIVAESKKDPREAEALEKAIEDWGALVKKWNQWECLRSYGKELKSFATLTGPEDLWNEFDRRCKTVGELPKETSMDRIPGKMLSFVRTPVVESNTARLTTQYNDAHELHTKALETYQDYFKTRCLAHFESLSEKNQSLQKTLRELDTTTFEEKAGALKTALLDFDTRVPELTSPVTIQAALDKLRAKKVELAAHEATLNELKSECKQRDQSTKTALEARRKDLTTKLQVTLTTLKTIPESTALQVQIRKAMPVLYEDVIWDEAAVKKQCEDYERFIETANNDFIILKRRLDAYQLKYQAVDSLLKAIHAKLEKYREFLLRYPQKQEWAIYEEYNKAYDEHVQKHQALKRANSLSEQDESDIQALQDTLKDIPARLAGFGKTHCFPLAKTVNNERFENLNQILTKCGNLDSPHLTVAAWVRQVKALEEQPTWDGENVRCVFPEGFQNTLDDCARKWNEAYNAAEVAKANEEYTEEIESIKIDFPLVVLEPLGYEPEGDEHHFTTVTHLQATRQVLIDRFNTEKANGVDAVKNAELKQKETVSNKYLDTLRDIITEIRVRNSDCNRYLQRQGNPIHQKLLDIFREIDQEIMRLHTKYFPKGEAKKTISEITNVDPFAQVANYGDSRINKLVGLRKTLGDIQNDYMAKEEQPKDSELKQAVLDVLQPYTKPEKLEEFAQSDSRRDSYSILKFFRRLVYKFQSQRDHNKKPYFLGWLTPATSAKNVQRFMVEAIHNLNDETNLHVNLPLRNER